jgi:hypothetical protein
VTNDTPQPGIRLATLISVLVVLTLFVGCFSATLALALAGNWDKHRFGMTLALKVMWGVWLLLLVATVLTHVTAYGWRFRRGSPRAWGAALYRTVREGAEPPAWFHSGRSSFTITVILVSLFGGAFLASMLLWIIGDWRDDNGPLILTLKIIWGTWWVLAIATVLVRVGIFARQRQKLREQKAAQAPPAGPPPANGQDGEPAAGPAPQRETSEPPS